MVCASARQRRIASASDSTDEGVRERSCSAALRFAAPPSDSQRAARNASAASRMRDTGRLPALAAPIGNRSAATAAAACTRPGGSTPEVAAAPPPESALCPVSPDAAADEEAAPDADKEVTPPPTRVAAAEPDAELSESCALEMVAVEALSVGAEGEDEEVELESEPEPEPETVDEDEGGEAAAAAAGVGSAEGEEEAVAGPPPPAEVASLWAVFVAVGFAARALLSCAERPGKMPLRVQVREASTYCRSTAARKSMSAYFSSFCLALAMSLSVSRRKDMLCSTASLDEELSSGRRMVDAPRSRTMARMRELLLGARAKASRLRETVAKRVSLSAASTSPSRLVTSWRLRARRPVAWVGSQRSM
mmetsp:Transcript_778/g.2420  ORF Transcript_778/g.2420 Transcript_778/m.2420 type:complete len:364 (+) Transcript_778:3074-4165(+)